MSAADSNAPGLLDRARLRVGLWQSAPNPLWIRELRQSARMSRTPVALAVLVVLMTMLITSTGGMVSTDSSPATTGVVIFQTFFSLSFFLVAIIGPAVAANSIASEREGRTWEAVILTGLSPATIARGKFLAAFTAIAMYVVTLAPVGALPYLFGGVTTAEIVVAFGGLFLVALLSVAFGLAVSSRMTQVRSAIVVTLLLAFPASVVAFLVFGVLMSIGAHKVWPAVPQGPPIWLPTAYARAPFGVEYLILLVILPVVGVIVPAWFLYEVTIANLTSSSDDHTSGLKRWFLVATPLLTAAAAIPIVMSGRDSVTWTIIVLSIMFVFLVFSVFLFAGDSIGPSRRVKLRWDRARASWLRRFLGPGTMSSATLILVASALTLGGLGAAGVIATLAASHGASIADAEARGILLFGGYALGFVVFVTGLCAWLRARIAAPITARLILLAVIFLIAVGPWVVAAVGGLLQDRWSEQTSAIAAPSPFFAFTLVNASTSGHGLTIGVGLAAMTAWAALGVVLLGVAARKCRGIISRHEAALAEGSRRLAEEDARQEAPR